MIKATKMITAVYADEHLVKDYMNQLLKEEKKMARITLKIFLSQIQLLRIKMTKIAINVLGFKVLRINIHLYPSGKLIQTLWFRVKGWSLRFRI